MKLELPVSITRIEQWLEANPNRELEVYRNPARTWFAHLKQRGAWNELTRTCDYVIFATGAAAEGNGGLAGCLMALEEDAKEIPNRR